ncbi:unnamed protein product [Oreochromis niloticus]|nr:unnamed protein product [Mustela putorius furo]
MLKSALFVFLFSSFLGRLDCADNKQTNANHGDNVTLACYSPRDVVILMLRWKKQDVQRYALFIRENRIDEKLQDPSFKGRVELKDPEMKNGELSVILKNVTVKDNGVYECYAGYNDQEPQLLNSITLTVDPPDVPVKRGEEIILECYGPKNATTRLLKWNNTDMKSEFYVFYFRDGKPYENYQDPHFKDRVKLKDPEMKNGDFSVILKNVTMNDTGRYECYAGYNNQEPQLINITNLKVEEPGQTREQSENGGEEAGVKESGSLGLIVGLSVLAVLVIVGVGAVFIYRTYRRRHNPDYQPPEDQGL